MIVTCEGAFQVKTVEGGVYEKDLTLNALKGGSIHALEEITVKGTLTIHADDAATIGIPAKVTALGGLIVKSRYSSNVNTNRLISGDAVTPKFELFKSGTESLYMVVNSGKITGSVKDNSTLHLWVDFPNELVSDTVTVDHTSSYTRRSWNAPK